MRLTSFNGVAAMTLPFYPFYWGDYSSKTFNLTIGQHGAYMLLLRHVYVEQQRIPDEKRYEIGKAITDEDKRNVDEILAKYFLKKDGKWRNERAEEIISKQHEIHEVYVKKGKKGGRPPKPQLNSSLTPNKVGPKQPEPEPYRKRKTAFLEGKEGSAESSSKVFVKEGSDAFKAWAKHLNKPNHIAVECRVDGRIVRGWHFPSEWPPSAGNGPASAST